MPLKCGDLSYVALKALGAGADVAATGVPMSALGVGGNASRSLLALILTRVEEQRLNSLNPLTRTMSGRSAAFFHNIVLPRGPR